MEHETTENDVLRIGYLEAENVKRLKAVRLRPDKTLVKIEGRNAAGKSSVLDAIAAALGGGKQSPELPVRVGAKKAKVHLDLGEIQVERRWTAGGGTVLEVTAKDGAKLASPQKILDALVSDCTFDPLAFVRAKPAEQADTLKRIAGLDWSALETERAEVFAERTTMNREAKAAQARLGSPASKPTSMTPIDVADLAEKQRQIDAHNRAVEDAHRAAEQAKAGHSRAEDTVGEARRQLDEAEQRATQIMAEAEVRLEAVRGEAAKAAKYASELENKAKAMKPQESGNLADEMAKAQAHNESIAAYRTYQERRKQADEMQAAADTLTNRIDAIDEKKAEMLAKASFPLDGLGIDTNGVLFNGIPFSQASLAEQLKVGVAIGLAQKPRCRIILIRDGSLLDDDSLDALHAIATDNDAQVFLERVASSASPSAVFIEDGEIVEQEEADGTAD